MFSPSSLYLPQGAGHSFQCVRWYSDGGKSCSSSEACQGRCVLKDIGEDSMKSSPQGICQSNDSIAGCISFIEDKGFVRCTD